LHEPDIIDAAVEQVLLSTDQLECRAVRIWEWLFTNHDAKRLDGIDYSSRRARTTAALTNDRIEISLDHESITPGSLAFLEGGEADVGRLALGVLRSPPTTREQHNDQYRYTNTHR
jgi:hypothetical protein